MRGKISILWKEVLLLTFSILLFLCLVEGTLQAIKHVRGKEATFYVKNIEFEMWVHWNEDGLRGQRVSPSSTSGHSTVFVIGDSFMYGVGVKEEQSIPILTEKMFDQQRLCDVSVFNLGRPGAGPILYAQTASWYQEYQPKVVFVGLYVDNDIESIEETNARKRELLDNIQRKQPFFSRLATVTLIKTAVTNLHAYFQPQNTCPAQQKTGVNIPSFKLPAPLEKAMCDETMNPHLLPRGRVGDNNTYYEQLTRRFNEDATTKEKLLEVRNYFPKSTFILLLIPSKYQVSTNYFQAMRELGFVFEEEKVVDRRLQDSIIAWANHNNIETIDLLPLISEKEQSSGIRLYYHFDDHLNEQGTQFIANVLHNRLSNTDLCQQ